MPPGTLEVGPLGLSTLYEVETQILNTDAWTTGSPAGQTELSTAVRHAQPWRGGEQTGMNEVSCPQEISISVILPLGQPCGGLTGSILSFPEVQTPQPRLVPGLSSLGLRTSPSVGRLPHRQPRPDEGHPPPLEAVPVSWKSVGSCRSLRESPGGLAETSAGEEAPGQEGPAAAQLDVSRLRSSSMEIREKGSEFLKEELHKAQKVRSGAGRGAWGGWGPWPPRPESSRTCRSLCGA